MNVTVFNAMTGKSDGAGEDGAAADLRVEVNSPSTKFFINVVMTSGVTSSVFFRSIG